MLIQQGWRSLCASSAAGNKKARVAGEVLDISYVFPAAEAIWARLRPSFCAEMQKAIVGKGSKWDNQDSKNHYWYLWFQCDSHLWAATATLHGLHWPSNLILVMPGRQLSRLNEAGKPCNRWALASAPGGLMQPLIVLVSRGFRQKQVIVHWWGILGLSPSFTIQVVPVAKPRYMDQFA